jgi:hypothetical protein
MSNCQTLLTNLIPSCEALNKVGGVKKRVWVAAKSQINSYTIDNDGYISALTMKSIPGTADPIQYYSLAQFEGKRDKHDFGVTGVPGENVNTFNHTGTLVLFAFTPAEIAAIEKAYNADDLVIFTETNAGQVKAYGLELGLNGAALEYKEGVLLNDPTAVSITFEGEQLSFPKVFKVGTTIADIIALLDAKTGATA